MATVRGTESGASADMERRCGGRSPGRRDGEVARYRRGTAASAWTQTAGLPVRLGALQQPLTQQPDDDSAAQLAGRSSTLVHDQVGHRTGRFDNATHSRQRRRCARAQKRCSRALGLYAAERG